MLFQIGRNVNHLSPVTHLLSQASSDSSLYLNHSWLCNADKTLGIDGNRPITPSNFDVKEVVYEDGRRPIETDKAHVLKMLPVDGNRPITLDNLETPDMIRDYID